MDAPAGKIAGHWVRRSLASIVPGFSGATPKLSTRQASEALSARHGSGRLDELLGSVCQVEEGGQRRENGMSTDASNSLSRSGEIDQSSQRRRMLAAALRANRHGIVRANELHSGSSRNWSATDATRLVDRLGLALKQEWYHRHPSFSLRHRIHLLDRSFWTKNRYGVSPQNQLPYSDRAKTRKP
jgi:hypothetical protein